MQLSRLAYQHSLSMILITLLLAFIVGLWNKPTKLKSMRTGRCACNSWCFENHMECPLNSEVWNSILILSCLSALLPMAEGHERQALLDIQTALKLTRHLFNDSNARLYTPNPEQINSCTNKFLDCFLMEMLVVLHEGGSDVKQKLLVERTLEYYKKEKCSERHPCELEELAPYHTFWKKMTDFLEKQQTLCQPPSSNKTCD